MPYHSHRFGYHGSEGVGCLMGFDVGVAKKAPIGYPPATTKLQGVCSDGMNSIRGMDEAHLQLNGEIFHCGDGL